MDDIRVGVIGSGGRGGLAGHAHKPGEGSRVVACCDLSEDVLSRNRERYGDDVFTTSDYRELVQQDLDAIFVCSPDFLHEEHALAALEQGRAVYLEKPMTITVEGCDRVLVKAREKGARLFVGHNMRYMSIIRRMKELIDNDEIGEIKSVWCRHFISYGGDAYFHDWHSEAKYATGLLLQKGAHDIDVMHWLAGAYSTRVSAFGNIAVYDKCARRKPEEKGDASFNSEHWPPLEQTGFSPVIDVEDQTTMIMEMEGGILGSYLQCHFAPIACRNYCFIGTRGMIENRGDGVTDPIMVWRHRDRSPLQLADTVVRAEPAKGSHGGADPQIVEEFIRYVRDGGETTATPEAARMAVAAGYLATMSLREGGVPKEVPALP